VAARLALLFWLVLGGSALALSSEAPLPDPALEARAKALFHELRCVVCQGESVADSPAEVAAAVRLDVRTRIAKGASDQSILDLMAQQYGENILMTPPLAANTALLWFAPLMMLGLAGLLARWYFKQAKES
jgi:cytochrome c-type biogenesis protein CcmH